MNKKIISSVMAAVLTFGICGCSEQSVDPVTEPVYDEPIIASQLVEKEGRQYIESNGVPYLFMGIQIRVDYLTRLEKQEPEKLERYFELARGMNVTSVQIPIAWSDVEPEKDRYTSEVIDTYMGFCNKYDLKMEILWYGSNMCGSTEGGGRSAGTLENGSFYVDTSGHFTQGHVPFYISIDPDTYPRYPVRNAEWVFGRHYRLIPDAETTMEREAAAITYLMNAVWEYDRTHGGKRTVIGVQVENEPNMIYTYPDIVNEMSAAGVNLDEVKEATLRQLDVMGQAVKNSKYKTYTRVNLSMTGDHWDFAEKCAATEGIDFVGMDAYGYDSYVGLNGVIDDLQAIPGNYANIPEMGGDYSNNDALQLLTFKKGGGYSVFELVSTTSEFFADWRYIALYTSDLNKTLWTDRLMEANAIFRGGACILASAKEEDFLAFNLLAQQNSEEMQTSSSCDVTWSTQSRGIAYAVEKDGYLLFASTQADTMQIEGVLMDQIEFGIYDSFGKWQKDGDANGFSSNKIILEPGRIYRAKIG